MLKIKDITQYLESIAPTSYQESYDNAGLITGNPNTEVKGVLISLDCIEEVVDEAIEKGCNLIVAHHPIVFFGMKRLNGKNYVERTIIKAIKNDIGIYAIHTNLDNVLQGVNDRICDKIGLENRRILLPKKNTLLKLVTFVPLKDRQKVLDALSEAGAGNVGNYSQSSFQSEGLGTFKPNEQTNPHIGEQGELTTVDEIRLEVILPTHLQGKVIASLNAAHPYEEVAYYLHALENVNQEVGSGMIGQLPAAIPAKDFLLHLKDKMQLSCIRYTQLSDKPVQKIAVCGGAGSFLLKHAKRAGADVFITGDFKYHEFFDAEQQIVIADIGHYESEVFTKDLLRDMLIKQFQAVQLIISQVNTNPISYL